MKKIKSFILDHFEGFLVVLIFIGIMAIAFLVYYKFSFLNFFFLPVILSGYFLGKKRAVLTGIFCILLVILYMFFYPILLSQKVEIFLDTIINLITWGSFLLLAGYIVGNLFEQKETQLKNLRQAYIGGLEIVLNYLMVADKEKPRSMRVSLLAGKIAEAAGLKTSEVEDIKAAAMLFEAGDLRVSLPFFHEAADFVSSQKKIDQTGVDDREKIALQTTASLLKAIEPILVGYFRHYVKDADIADKNLDDIPLGSSIIALANIYDKFETELPPQEGEGIRKWDDIERLSGRSFHRLAVTSLREVVKSL